ncbi:MAG: extracellular solute-binding protein [Methylophilaceae bacterium]
MKFKALVVAMVSAVCVANINISSAASDKLNVMNWSELIGKDTVAKFSKEYKIKVKYDLIDSDETIQTKLLSGRSGYDVVFPSVNYMEKQVAAGVFEKLDMSKIPNAAKISPQLLAKANMPYGVIYTWGTSGFIVNATKARQLLGKDAKLDTWDVLFNPAIVSKLKGCGVSLLDSSSDVFANALAYMGRDPNSKKLSDYQDAYNMLMKIRPYITQFTSTTMRTDIAGGDVCVAEAWNGDGGGAIRGAKEAKKPFEVLYVTPKGQTGIWMTMMGIPKDAPNKENAYKFINYQLRPEIAAAFSNETTYATAAPSNQVSAELLNDKSAYPSEADFKDSFVFANLDPKAYKLMNKLFLQFKAGR